MIADMGIHDFDLARWYMGDVATVQAIGATLAYPELGEVGDIDNAIVTMTSRAGSWRGRPEPQRDLRYDISTELLGTAGTIRIGYLRETPILVMTKNSIAHDTVPYSMERFRDAYTVQLENFAENVLSDREPPVQVSDRVRKHFVSRLRRQRRAKAGNPLPSRASNSRQIRFFDEGNVTRRLLTSARACGFSSSINRKIERTFSVRGKHEASHACRGAPHRAVCHRAFLLSRSGHVDRSHQGRQRRRAAGRHIHGHESRHERRLQPDDERDGIVSDREPHSRQDGDRRRGDERIRRARRS